MLQRPRGRGDWKLYMRHNETTVNAARAAVSLEMNGIWTLQENQRKPPEAGRKDVSALLLTGFGNFADEGGALQLTAGWRSNVAPHTERKPRAAVTWLDWQ